MCGMTGQEQFRDWMRRRGFTQRDASRYLGWNEAYVSRLLSDDDEIRIKALGLDNALHLERLSGIPVEAWESNALDESEPAVISNGSKRKVS